MLDLIPFLPFVILSLLHLYRQWDEAKHGTPKERAKRQMRDFEHACLVDLGARDLLLRMLLSDLKQMKARRELAEFMRREFNVDIDEPLPSIWPRLPRIGFRRRRP